MRKAMESERAQILVYLRERGADGLADHARTAPIRMARDFPGWTSGRCDKVAIIFGTDGSTAMAIVGFHREDGEPCYVYDAEFIDR